MYFHFTTCVRRINMHTVVVSYKSICLPIFLDQKSEVGYLFYIFIYLYFKHDEGLCLLNVYKINSHVKKYWYYVYCMNGPIFQVIMFSKLNTRQ